MKTIYETEIGIEKKIIILTTKTVEFLLNKNPDSLSLYMFYIKNAKIQKTNSIFNVESFGMKGLGWGRDRYRNAKKILVEEKFIEDIIKKDEQGKIIGHYLKINYLFAEDTIKETIRQVSHPVDSSIGGEQKTNALSNKTINALSNETKIQSSVEESTEKIIVKPKTKKQLREESPFIFKEELNNLFNSGWKGNKIIHNFIVVKKFVLENRKQFDTLVKRNKVPANNLLGYTSKQINDTMDYCEKNYQNFNWGLETVVKTIPNIVNKK